MFHFLHTPLPFIVILLVVLASAKVLGEISERFGQPSMIGELVAGIILGPSILNLVQVTGELKVIADLGVFLLIVIAGMEIEVEKLRNAIRGRQGAIAFMGFVIPFISGFFLGRGFHYNYVFSIFLGLCIAITALPVSIRILMDLGKLSSDVGQSILSTAITKDVVSLLILGIILDFNNPTKGLEDFVVSTTYAVLKVILFMTILWVAYRLFKLLKKEVGVINPKVNTFLNYLKGKESLFAMVIVFVLIFASMAEFLGMHFIIGAFFGAILFPRSIVSREDFSAVKRSTTSITMGFLSPIFFAYIGITLNLGSISNIPLLLMVLAASFLSMIAGGYLGGRMAGFNREKSFAIGLGLNARGLMELVIASIALQKGFIDVPFFSILVIMALLTTVMTPVLLKRAFARIKE